MCALDERLVVSNNGSRDLPSMAFFVFLRLMGSSNASLFRIVIRRIGSRGNHIRVSSQESAESRQRFV